MTIKTRITPTEELVEIFIENLFNNTNAVTKVSDLSVVRGIAFGNSKLANKILKETALIESRLFQEDAFGEHLDEIADREGFPARFGANGSSTWVLVVGSPNTTYTAGTHTFTGKHGVVFNIVETVTIPNTPISPSDNLCFAYVRVSSQTSGLSSNVDPLTLNIVSPIPSGHSYCVNEYAAIGGQDAESDELMRVRLFGATNILAKSTMECFTQVLYKINPRVLRVFHHGINSAGRVVLGIVCVDGGVLSTNEKSDINDKLQKVLAISDNFKVSRSEYFGFVIEDVGFTPIDIDFRVEFFDPSKTEETRKEIQIGMNKYLDYRYWNVLDKVQWEELFFVVKNTPNVKYVPDEYFNPPTDTLIQSNKLPRIRSFIMRDLAGTILNNVTGTLNPVFFPNYPDLTYQRTILSNI